MFFTLIALTAYFVVGFLLTVLCTFVPVLDDALDLETPSLLGRIVALFVLPWVVLLAFCTGDGGWSHLKVGLQIIFSPLFGKGL